MARLDAQANEHPLLQVRNNITSSRYHLNQISCLKLTCQHRRGHWSGIFCLLQDVLDYPSLLLYPAGKKSTIPARGAIHTLPISAELLLVHHNLKWKSFRAHSPCPGSVVLVFLVIQNRRNWIRSCVFEWWTDYGCTDRSANQDNLEEAAYVLERKCGNSFSWRGGQREGRALKWRELACRKWQMWSGVAKDTLL